MSRYTPEITHKIMSAVKSSNTKPELLLRKAVWQSGLRYRVNVKSVYGKPDIVFTRAKIAVFCDGDFWHGHNWVIRGLSSLDEELERYSDYWRKKIIRNIERDKEVNDFLEKSGWCVIRLWESEIEKDVSSCVERIKNTYRERTPGKSGG